MCAGIFGGVVQDVPLTRKGIRNETKAGWANIALTSYYSIADPDPHGSALFCEAGYGSKSKIRSCGGSKWSHGESWTLVMEAWWLKMEPWRFGRQMVADWHHFYEEQDPNLDPHQSKKRDPDPHQSDNDQQHYGILHAKIFKKKTATDFSLPNILHTPVM